MDAKDLAESLYDLAHGALHQGRHWTREDAVEDMAAHLEPYAAAPELLGALDGLLAHHRVRAWLDTQGSDTLLDRVNAARAAISNATKGR